MITKRPWWQRTLRALLLRIQPAIDAAIDDDRPSTTHRIPAPTRVARAVACQRAMVQVANALAATAEELPDSIMCSFSYPDGLTLMLSMSLHGPDEDTAP